ncbi:MULTISPECIES: sugar phosphate isomerase/epimerase [unclassified Crossiella]|uniref:sugar phosphate isomerase/epimerase family protein n=1 Tax=unclassified Crossiella TaxID=2620835 RepID=UPI001FFF266C|nr:MULTISPECIES: TIM barrel protein [unclassified Crossiella]MCK2241163.1 sugar phosphate isomerase/epimerase [Crossiella sp. S99.2]MCK2253693.1 sugar phosphate isomerase/epimerase [Crossiella sp. S99.1]
MIVPGLVSVTFRQLGVPEVVRLTAAAGLEAIEWGGDVHVPAGDLAAAETARELTAAAGLTVAAYGSYYRAGHSDPADLDPVVRTAAALGAPLIRVWAGMLGSAEATPAQRACTVQALRRAGEAAAGHGMRIALEYHRNTLTDTLASATALFAEVDRAEVVPYWQPAGGQPGAVALTEVRALLPELVTTHVFSWGPGGGKDRLPLAERADLWQPVLAELAADGRDRFALVEFVPEDSPAIFLRDAATLRDWLTHPLG